MILHLFLPLVLGLLPLKSFGIQYHVDEISHFEINSAISPATYDYLNYHFSKVPENSLILIKINTPGGLISTTKDIISLIGKQTKPVAIWVTPEGASAASAGAIISSAAHFILMSSGTSIGAATPVGLGEDLKESDGRSKALNDLKALVRSLSHSRGRAAEPFEEMIQTAKSFTDQEALKAGIIDGIVAQDRGVKKILSDKSFSLQGKTFELTFSSEVLSKNYELTLGQSLLSVLANPSTAYILFLLGLALIYFEFQTPGGFVAGGVGISFVILAAIAFQVLPLHWGSLTLMLLGAVLLILEIYVTSYGLLALGGIASFTVGSLFLFHGESGFISVNYTLLFSALAGVASSVGIIVVYLIKQKTPNEKSDFFLPIGSTGVVLSQDEIFIQVKVKGEIWRGHSLEKLVPGDTVEVVSVDSNKLIAEFRKSHKE